MTRLNAENGGLMTDKITFRLDEKRCEELDHFAKQHGVTISFLVRHLVIRYLEERRRFDSTGGKIPIYPGGFHVQ